MLVDEVVTEYWRNGRGRTAICPIGWVNGFLGWGHASGAEVMDDIARIGYAASENSAVYPADPQRLQDELQGRGLVLSGAYRWVNFAYEDRLHEEIEAAKRHVEFCALAGADVANLAEAAHSVWDARGPAAHVTPLSGAQWRRVAAALEEVGQFAQQLGVSVAVHPHGGTAIETPAEILTLLELTDPALVGLCLDTGHVVYGGGDPVELARQVGERVVYVHLKDVRQGVLAALRGPGEERARGGHSVPRSAASTHGAGTGPHVDAVPGLSALGVGFEDAVRRHLFCPPGQGYLDFGAVLGALRAVGYDGWYVVEAEQDPDLHDPLEAGRSAHAYLSDLLVRPDTDGAP